MEQELGRTDLLSVNVPTAVIFIMMVLLVAAWWISQRFKPLMPNRAARFGYFFVRVFIGSLALWSVWQFTGRYLVLATTWSLWFSAILGAGCLEFVGELYHWERSIVSERLGKALVWLRSAAVLVVSVILIQPVFSREAERTIDRDVVVLLDESESMQLVDKRLSISEKLDLAALFGSVAVLDRPRLGELRDAVGESLGQVKVLSERLVLPEGAGAESIRRVLEKRKPDLLEVLSQCETRNQAQLATVRALLSDESKLSGNTQKLLKEAEKRFAESIEEQLSEAKRRMDEVKKEEVVATHAAVLKNLGTAAEHYQFLAQRLPQVMVDADKSFYNALSNEVRNEVEEQVARTRSEIARQILLSGEDGPEGSLLNALGEKYNLKLVRFAQEPVETDLLTWMDPSDLPAQTEAEAVKEESSRTLTDLASALEYAIKSVPSENLAGVLVLTDGRHNAEKQVEDAARRLGVQNAPVCSVLIGGSQGPKDASVLVVAAPESIYLGDKIVVKADLKFDGLRGQKMNVALLFDGEPVDEAEIAIPEEGYRYTQRFKHTPEEKGIFRYSLQIEVVEGELYDTNNQWDFEVAVTDDRTNVLIVDSFPRWEFRYLRNLFYGRDKSVHLQYVLTDPDVIDGQEKRDRIPASAARDFGDAEATAVPEDLSEWLKFDAIILGDIDPNYFDDEAWEHLEYCVSRRGAMLVLIAGPRFMPHAYQVEQFKDLCPVIYTQSSEPMYDSPDEAFRIVATAEGRNHLIMQQSSSPSINAQIWGSIPPIMWRHGVEQAKEGAEVLAYAEPVDLDADHSMPQAATDSRSVEEAIAQLANRKELERKNPLVVLQRYEQGKVVMFCFDRTWRLRYRVGDTYHHRLWGQVLRWGTGENLRSGTDLVRLGTDQLSYTPHDPVKVIAKLVDEESRPVIDDEVSVSLFKDDQLVLTKRLDYREDSNGIYEALLNPLDDPGRYRVELRGKKAGKLLALDEREMVETELRVVTTKNPVELAELTADREIPTRVATLSSGAVATPGGARKLMNYFGEAREVLIEQRETPLWHTWPLFMAFIGLVTTEWILRKKGGLA